MRKGPAYLARCRQWNGGTQNLPHVQIMTGTSAGASKSAWHKYMKECAKRYQKQQKADKVTKDDPHAIRQEKEGKERVAAKRRLKGQPVHDASHRITEAHAGKAGKAGKHIQKP